MADPQKITLADLLASLESPVSGPTTGTPASNPAFTKLLQDLLKVNKDMLKEMQNAKRYTENVAEEIEGLNKRERKESNSNKKNKDYDKASSSSKLGKELLKFLREQKKIGKQASKVSSSALPTPSSIDVFGDDQERKLLERWAKKGIIPEDALKNLNDSTASFNQLLVGSESFSRGISSNITRTLKDVIGLKDNYNGLLSSMLEGVSAQAKYTQEVRAALYETGNITKENKKLFSTLEDIENITTITGFKQEEAQQNILKIIKSGVKLEGNAAKYREKLVNLTESQLSTEKQIGLEAGDLFETFNKLYQAGRLTEGEIADIGRGMRDIARQTGLTGKNLQAALNAAQPILDSMRKASTLTASAVKNVTQGIAAAEKLGVTDQAKTILEAASSSTNLFFNTSKETQALLYSAASSVGKIGDLQKGVLTRSKEGIKSLSQGITNILKRFGIESLDAIDNLSDSAKLKLNLSLKSSFGLELGEVRGVVESLTEAGKGYGDRVADIEKKLKTNLTLEEKTSLLEEKRRLQTNQSLEALTVLDKAAVGAKNMDEALGKFGERRKEFEKDLQALGLKGTNKEVIKGALQEAIKGIENSSKKSLGITSAEIQKALEDPVSFREVTSKITKAEQSSATKQKTQLDATTETNQKLEEIKTEIQKSSSSFISSFMSNAGPLGVIAASVALSSGPSLLKGLKGLITGGGGGITGGPAPLPVPTVGPAPLPVPAGGAAPPAAGAAGGAAGGMGALAKNIVKGGVAVAAVTAAVAGLALVIFVSYKLLTAAVGGDVDKLIESIDFFTTLSIALSKAAIGLVLVGTILAGIGYSLGLFSLAIGPTLVALGLGSLAIAGMAIAMGLFVATVGEVLIRQAESMGDPSDLLNAAAVIGKVSFGIASAIFLLTAAAAIFATIGIASLVAIAPAAVVLTAAAIGLSLFLPALVIFLNSVGNTIVNASSAISNPDALTKAGEKVAAFASAAGSVISSILGIQWDVAKLSVGGGLMMAGTAIFSLFGSSPQDVIRNSLNAMFSLVSGVVNGINSSEAKYGLTPEIIMTASSKLDKYKESNKKLFSTLGELSDSFSSILTSSANVTKDLGESTKNVPTAKIKETLDSAKGMTSIFSEFLGAAKDFDKNLNVKNLNQLKKTLGDSILPEVLNLVFKNVENTIKTAKSYQFSNIELKGLSEKLNALGGLVKGIGDAAKGVQEVNSALEEMKKSAKIRGGDFSKKEKEIKDFLESVLKISSGLMKIATDNSKDFNMNNVGKVEVFIETLSIFLESMKSLLINFKNNVVDPMQELANSPNMTNIINADYKGQKQKINGISAGFINVIANITDMFTLTDDLRADLAKKKGENYVAKIKETVVFVEEITKAVKSFSGFLQDFNSNIVAQINELASNRAMTELIEIDYQGQKQKVNKLSNGMLMVLRNVTDMFTLANNLADELKATDAEGKSSLSKFDGISEIKPKLKEFSSFLVDFGSMAATLNSMAVPQTGGAEFGKKVDDFKATKNQTIENLKNVQATFFDETFIKSLSDFTVSVPKIPELKTNDFVKFSESLMSFVKVISSTFSSLDEPLKEKDAGPNPNNLIKVKNTISSQITTAKDFFSGDFIPLLQSFSTIVGTLKGANFNDKEFEKVSKTIESFVSIITGIKTLIESFGVIGYELTTTSIQTGDKDTKKSVTTLKFMKDLLSNSETSEFASLMSSIPGFITKNILEPFGNSPVKISPQKVEKIAKTLEATVKVLNALTGKDGLLRNLGGKLDPEQIKASHESLKKLKEIGPNIVTVYGEVKNSGKTSYLLAEFIISLIQNVIEPLSILNNVTNPKKLDKTAKIIESVTLISKNLPNLITGVNDSIDKLMKVDDSKLPLIKQVTVKLEEFGKQLPEFVSGLVTNVIFPLSAIPLSPKALDKISSKITSITTIVNNLPVLIESLSSKLPSLLKNLESVDGSLGKKFGDKGETFKEVFVGLLKFIMSGVIIPLLTVSVSPKLLQKAASQIDSLAKLSGSLGPIFIGFFKSMDELLKHIETTYGNDASTKINNLVQIFSNDFFQGNFANISDSTIENLNKVLKIQDLMDEITGFDASSLSNVFAEADFESLNADAMENALINFGEQLDRIVEIMAENVDKINSINSLGEIKINGGEVSTAVNAEMPNNKSYDMFSQNLQMKEASGSASGSEGDELLELNKTNEEMNSKQAEMIDLLSGILESLSLTGPSSNTADQGPFSKQSNLKEFSGTLSAKLQTGTTNRSAYVSGSNMVTPVTGPFV